MKYQYSHPSRSAFGESGAIALVSEGNTTGVFGVITDEPEKQIAWNPDISYGLYLVSVQAMGGC